MNQMVQYLMKFEADRLDLEELTALSSFARSLRAEFEALALEVPEWLDNQTRSLRREIGARVSDSRDKRLRELKARRAALATPEEKRVKIEAEIAALEAQLSA